ncbi:MAG: hypothetical protein QOD07_1335 [Frankiaceae bacterium]|jgi:hypothetical protein|nr:hypothetical protein [Frankiaceae bacterium]
MTVSRRTILVAMPVGAAAAACRNRSPKPPPDPDAAALAGARDTEQRLVAAYDAAGDTMRRDLHAAHLSALAGTMPSALPALPADPTGLVRGSVAPLQAAAVGARSGHVAAVLASIAASHLSGS